jgi:predicted RND superfamily exporter protein
MSANRTLHRFEEWFGSLATRICRRPVMALMIVMLGVMGAMSQMPKVKMDTSTEGLLREDDPILQTYNKFREQFGREEMIYVLIRTDNVFDLPFLKRLKAFHEAIEEKAPHLRKVTSLVNARDTRATGDSGISVDDLLKQWPTNAQELAALKARVLGNHLLVDRLVSKDGKLTAVLVETLSFSGQKLSVDEALAGFDDKKPAPETKPERQILLTEKENGETITAIRALMDQHKAPGFEPMISGSPVISADVKTLMMTDMPKFLMMGILIISVLLAILFRRITGVLLPLVIVIVSLITTIGIMSATGTPLKIPTQILPTFLLVIGISDAVHILALFYPHYNQGGDKRESIIYAVRHAAVPVVLTSLTTFVGLISFAGGKVAPIGELGLFGGVGELVAMTFTLILLPALLMIVPIRQKPNAPVRKWTLIGRLARLALRRPWPIIGAFAVITAAAIAIAFARLEFRHNPLSWLPEDMPVRQATEVADRELAGSISVEVLIDTKRENGLKSAEFLTKLDAMSRELEKVRDAQLFVGKASSVADIVKEINKALNEDRAERYKVPDSDALVSQELLLFESSGSDDLTYVIDRKFQTARLSLQVPWLEAAAYDGLVQTIKDRFRAVYGDAVEVDVTGMMPLWGRTEHAAMQTAIRGYLIAGVVISLIMIFAAGGLRLGLVSMVPNLIPIVITVGLMALIGIPMNLFTLLIGTLSVGLCVDDTIHMLSGFRSAYAESGDPEKAVADTLATSGQAMVATSLALAAGFFVFLLSSMSNLREFGSLTAITLLIAMVTEFMLAVALLGLLHRKRPAPASSS